MPNAKELELRIRVLEEKLNSFERQYGDKGVIAVLNKCFEIWQNIHTSLTLGLILIIAINLGQLILCLTRK